MRICDHHRLGLDIQGIYLYSLMCNLSFLNTLLYFSQTNIAHSITLSIKAQPIIIQPRPSIKTSILQSLQRIIPLGSSTLIKSALLRRMIKSSVQAATLIQVALSKAVGDILPLDGFVGRALNGLVARDFVAEVAVAAAFALVAVFAGWLWSSEGCGGEEGEGED